MPGFKAFTMCRRDGKQADDGFNYQSVTIWQDRTSFENWTKSSEFGQAHRNAGAQGGAGAKGASGNGAAPQVRQQATLWRVLVAVLPARIGSTLT